jgi:hypothetical protein
MVRSATRADRTVFLKWLFASIALHPEIEAMVTISPGQCDEINKNAGALFMRLLTESCRDDMQQAFQVFGQAAATDLLGNPRTAEGMKGIDKYLDAEKLQALVSAATSTK